ncbi:MAG: single-stranded-DNA-specific exonuclease RecJ [Dysgonamonadaceae bacterium]|jgi:single-stranded-DNA-specific exonuclease|nr:single-stranded-DNA-specific exonuclease RecJ [Dysgonamonadaceae bacterium]
MTYKWNYLTLTNDQKNKKEKLSQEVNIDPVLAELLIRRGIDTKDEVQRFFRPDLKDLHDPFLMPDMEKAIKRIEKAIGDKERILIYGDYDVDGTTAVSLVYKFLRRITNNLDYYIPDRYDEGYGISEKGIEYAEKTGVKLIISLDCGIKAIAKVASAKEKGIDFIICDHHMPDDELPDAVAVVDAKRPDSTYPYQELSGCGVGFKLLHAFINRNGFDFSEIEPLLDLVAVSIASDIVPITGENRILMHYGLEQLNSNPSYGLKGIIDICGLSRKKIGVGDIVFKIGPRINASGRMMNGKEAVDLLLASDFASAREKSKNIDKYNEDRRELDKRITDEAVDFIDNHSDIERLKGIVIYNESWHKGIVGIVASRLTERYHRPAIVLTKSNDLISGSARSVAGFDVYKAIESCRDILENFGGHTYAAGLSLREENLEEFKRRFEQISFDEVNPKTMYPQITIDAEIALNRITPEFVAQLSKFAPFGPKNETPFFLSRKVFDAGGSRLVGKELHHIKMEIVDETVTSPVQAIAFGSVQYFETIKEKRPFDICYTVEENVHGSKAFIQLMIKDIRIP